MYKVLWYSIPIKEKYNGRKTQFNYMYIKNN